MHELGMCEGIVEATLRRAAGRRVTRVRVRVGGHRVDPDVVTQGFQVAAAGTVAADARLELVMDPLRVTCRGCGHDAPVDDHLAMVACPGCGGLDIELAGEDSVVLESISVESAREGEGLMDAIELLKHDHRMVEQLFRDYAAAKSDEQRRGVVEIMIRELSKHAALEELTVYPFAKSLLPDGAVDVDEHLSEHMAVKKTLAALDKLSAGDASEKQLVGELEHEVIQHVEEEESRFMPALRAAVDDDALTELGEQLDAAKRLAPTRPHPNIPDEPPAEAVLGAVGAIYDRLRDRLQGRPQT